MGFNSGFKGLISVEIYMKLRGKEPAGHTVGSTSVLYTSLFCIQCNRTEQNYCGH